MNPLPFKNIPHIVVYDRGVACSLEPIADQICSRTSSDHCSIFLVQNPTKMLLCATTAPRLSERVGIATYQIGEGLTGSVYKRLTTINVNLQSANRKRIIAPDFRWRSKHNEGSMFTGWMGSPVIYRNNFLGVVRIMRVHKIFSESERSVFEDECVRLSRLLYESEISETTGKFDLVTNFTFDQIKLCSGISDELLRRLAESPEERFHLDPRIFEQTVAELLDRMGYKVTLTPHSGDHGRDVIASIGTPGAPILVLVECKRYASHRLVGPGPIARLWSRVFDERANLGIVVTTSGFQPVAKKEASIKGYQMSLKDGDDFITWVRSVINLSKAHRDRDAHH